MMRVTTCVLLLALVGYAVGQTINWGDRCAGTSGSIASISLTSTSAAKALISLGTFSGLGTPSVYVNAPGGQDVDLRLYDVTNPAKPVILVGTGGQISTLTSKSIQGSTVAYSGVNGVGGRRGSEYIKITGDDTPGVWEFRLFGYTVGTYTFNVTWSSLPATTKCGGVDCTNSFQCADASACTNDVCSGGSCSNAALVCNDNSVCTTDSCNVNTGCVYTAISCNDNNLCTTDSCDAAAGCKNTAKTCDDSNVCTTDSCDSATGNCKNTLIPGCGSLNYPLPDPTCPTTKCVTDVNGAQKCYKIRREWRSMPQADQDLYIQAVQQLYASGVYASQFAYKHDYYSWYSHGYPSFFPWHRAFLIDFEEALRAQDPKYKCLTLPYWDTSQDASAEFSSPLISSTAFGPFSKGYWGCVTTGNFANWVDWTGNCFNRTNEVSLTFWTPAAVQRQISTTPNYGDSIGYRASIEGGPHAGPHIWLGGHMKTMRSPMDPLFYLNHGNIDRLWALWQDCWGYSTIPKSQINSTVYNPGSNPAAYGPDNIILGWTNPYYSFRNMHSITDNNYVYADTNWISAQLFAGVCSFSGAWFRDDTADTVAEVKADAGSVDGGASTVDKPIPAGQQVMVVVADQAYAQEIIESGDPQAALAAAVVAECAMTDLEKSSIAGSEWAKKNGLNEECKAGSCDSPCSDAQEVHARRRRRK